MALIGQDDLLDQFVSHDVAFTETDDSDPGTSRNTCAASMSPEALPLGRSIWVTSPVITALESKPRRVRNIFICSVVSFALVENHERIVQRPPPHVRQRRDLDRAALDEPGDPVGSTMW